MASDCYCGCGREIEGIRARANNEACEQISRHVAVMQGALERGDAGDRTAEVQAMADEGTALVAQTTRYLHGEVGRDDLDKAATKDWLKRGSKLADTLVTSASGLPWVPDDTATAHLAQSGTRGAGVVVDVRKDGMGNERVADLAITVSVRAADGTTTELTRSLSVPVVSAPRVGDRVEVAYDPLAPQRFLYRPDVTLP